MDYKNLTGWNIRFPNSSEKSEGYFSDESSLTDRSEHSVLKVPSGLHCGPADNYKLSRGIHNANPGVYACRLWQESQGLPDEVSKAIVGLLKLQGIPTNVTYKVLFENYLSKQLSMLMKRCSNDQKKLALLTDKMISMFQVTQIQPLIVDLLDLLEEIPHSAMSKILEDTASSHHFYKIATLNIKRKIWCASPEKLHETVTPLIYKCLFLLRLGIFDDEMAGVSRLNQENISEYNMLIGQILQLIGDPKSECSRVLYCQTMTILKFLFMKSCLQYKTNLSKVTKSSDGGVKVLISKSVECNLCFRSENFSELKSKYLDFHYAKVSCEDLCNLYTSYGRNTIGLTTLFNCQVTDFEPGEADVVLDIDKDMVYSDRGEHYYSTIYYSLALKCQEMYKITNADMKLIEPNFYLIQLISKVHNSTDNNLPIDDFVNVINKKNLHNIKDDLDLLNISFILSNPLLYNKVISYYVYYLYNMDLILLTSKNDVFHWLSIISLGLSCSYITLVKFILDSKPDGMENGKLVTFFKPFVNGCKPVSLKKLLSYIYPIDKRSNLPNLPPFFSNFISPTLSPDSQGNGFKRLAEFKIEDESVYNIPDDDPDTTFHSLLILFLPKLDSKLTHEFKSDCRSFSSLFSSDVQDGKSSTDDAHYGGKLVDFTSNFTRNVVDKILNPFNHKTFNSNSVLDRLISIMQRHFKSVKRQNSNTIGQVNFSFLYLVLKKMSILSLTIMNLLTSTSNITNLLFKLVTVELIKTIIKKNSNVNCDELVKFISTNLFNKETIVNFKTPTDYLYLRLLRTIMFSDHTKLTNVVFKFAENVSNYSVSTSFIILYYYKKNGKDKKSNQILDALSRNCHRILYDKENKTNPSYPYRKWLNLFEELKNSQNS